MLIRNASVFDGERLHAHLDVRVEGALVTKRGWSLQPVSGEPVVEAEGCVLAPGFIDVHIHGYAGHDMMEGEDAVRHMSRGLTRHGVTSFLPTTMSASVEETNRAVRAVSRTMGNAPGARVLGCHLEAPFLNARKKGAQRADTLLAPSLEAYRALVQGGEQAARLLTLAPELPGARALIEALRGEIVLSAGHTTATYDEMEQAAGWGISQVTHLFNAMNPLHHRDPSVPGAALSDDRLSVQMICDFVHLHPAVVRLAWASKGAGRCLLITDAMMATQMQDGLYDLGGQPVEVKAGQARLTDGTLAGSTLTMDQAVRNLIHGLGLPAADVLRMAATTPANCLGEGRLGVVREGCPADLVLLDSEWQVRATYVNGRMAYSS